MKKAIRCIRIGVDCIANVPVDVRSGGLEYLGFDFNVKKEEAEEMKKFIVDALNSFEIPLSSIFCYGEVDLSEDNVWTKEKIIEELIKIGKTYRSGVPIEAIKNVVETVLDETYEKQEIKRKSL